MPSPRLQRNTVFGFVEGDAEVVFVKYLQALYAPPRAIHIRVRPAGGKNPDYILAKAVKVRGGIPFNHSFILMDTDIEWSDELQARARDARFELIGSTPCIEGLFLSVLTPRTNHADRASSACKKDFERMHLGAARVINARDCDRLFPRSILDRARTRMAALHRLIQIMEGNFSP